MLTPQEVSEHAFAKSTFGGYNMAMVDEFLDELTEDYTALYKENASLKAKMKILADSLEEYRATEKGMRRALLAAQQAAEEMVKDAESRKSALVREAEADAQEKISELRRQVADEEARLAAAQAATADYVAMVREACRKQEESLDALSFVTAAPAPVDSVDEAAQAIEASVLKLIAQEDALVAKEDEVVEEPEMEDSEEEAEEEEEEEESDEPLNLYEEITARNRRDQERSRAFEDAPAKQDDVSATRRIDFDNLQFGTNYDLK